MLWREGLIFTSELDGCWDGIMVTRTREGQLVETFVTLADPLVVGYDVVDLLHTLVETCATLFGASAVGIILSAYNDNDLEVVASTNERSRLIEILQLRAGNGPCVECYTTGYPWPFPTSMSSPRHGHGSGRERSNLASSRCIRSPCGCERRPSDRSMSSGIASAVWERRTCARSRRWPTPPPSAFFRNAPSGRAAWLGRSCNARSVAAF